MRLQLVAEACRRVPGPIGTYHSLVPGHVVDQHQRWPTGTQRFNALAALFYARMSPRWANSRSVDAEVPGVKVARPLGVFDVSLAAHHRCRHCCQHCTVIARMPAGTHGSAVR